MKTQRLVARFLLPLALCGSLFTFTATLLAQRTTRNEEQPRVARPVSREAFLANLRQRRLTANFLSSANVTGLFYEAPTYPTGDSSRSVVAADVNGDGRLDLVTANYQPDPDASTISVLLGNGDGTFLAHVDFPIGCRGQSIAVADFNSDAKLDVAVVGYTDSVSVLLGNGNGTFQPYMEYPAGSNYGSFAIAASDVNNDGKADLVIVGDYNDSGVVSVLLGNGDGTFQPHLDSVSARLPRFVTVGDFNGDGKPDVATSNDFDFGRNIALSVLLGNGDGSFQSHVDYDTGTASGPLVTADVDRDGIADLIVSGFNTGAGARSTVVLLGNGDGTFQPGLGSGSYSLAVAVGDFNEDGSPDLAVADAEVDTGDVAISVLAGNDTGLFTMPPETYGTDADAVSIAVGDFNADRHLDLATVSWNSTADVLLGTGKGSFQSRVDYAIAGDSTSITTGDFNGDGKPDLTTANWDSPTLSVLLGNGDGTFGPRIDSDTGSLPHSVAAADFNRDGKLDLVTANWGAPYNVSVLLGHGDGTFESHVDYPAGGSPYQVATGDFNLDGNIDIAATNLYGASVSILLGNGDGTFRPSVQYRTASDPRGSMAVADVNLDGKPDLIIPNTDNNSVSVLLGRGDGSFRSHVDYSTGDCSSPRGVVVTDVNQDGLPDLVTANFTCFSTGTAGVLLGNGDGTFQAHQDAVVGNSPGGVVSADFDRDGKVDLAFANSSAVVLLGNGNGTFQAPLGFATGPWALYSIATADFNGDGMADLATSNSGAPTVSILLNTGLAATGPKASLSSTSITFATQLIGTSSMPQSVTLTNIGGLTLDISSITRSVNFSQTNNCGSSLMPGMSCSITVTFSPRGAGKLTGTVTIADNAADSPQKVSLTGTGTVVSLLPTSLSFGIQSVGTTSQAQTVNLTNSGKKVLRLSGIRISGTSSGAFAQSNTCGKSVPAGGTCTISVTFAPRSKGFKTATLNVRDDGGASPQTVPLSGTGK